MRFTNLMLALFALCLASTQSSANGTDMLLATTGCKKNPCVIKENLGGHPRMYEAAARELLRKGWRLIVDGRCYSGCVILASFARKNVCLTERARMALHRGTLRNVYEPFGKMVDTGNIHSVKLYFSPPLGYRAEMTFFTPDYGDDINAWAFRENKMPWEGVYVMTPQEALHFFKPCKQKR